MVADDWVPAEFMEEEKQLQKEKEDRQFSVERVSVDLNSTVVAFELIKALHTKEFANEEEFFKAKHIGNKNEQASIMNRRDDILLGLL